jgi:HSP20 family protein
MEVEKLKNWLDVTKHYAAESFWKEVFNQSSHPFSHEAEKIGKNLAGLAKATRLKDPFPRCDLYEKDGNLFVEAEVTGMNKEDINVMLRGQELTIQGVISTLKPQIHYFLKERPDTPFEKVLTLPFKVDKNNISSRFDNGLLTVILPIIPEEDAVPVHIDLAGRSGSDLDAQF